MASPPPQSSQPQQPVDPAPAQAPGQTPPAVMTMRKPGTVTGIQVILWIFLAIGAVGDVASIVNMIDYFDPIMLIALAYALYTTIQSVLTPVHIARGKRWAWIWNLVSAIIGLAFAAVGIVFGIILIDYGPLPLLLGIAFAALDGTLLGLLCSRSARQWILMHRIQRGEVQVAGTPGADGAVAGPGTAAAPRPERPETRPGVATVAVVAVWLFAALCAWGVWVNIRNGLNRYEQSEYISLPGAFLDGDYIWMVAIPLVVYTMLLICAVVCAPGLTKGAAGARIFGVVWSIGAVLLAGLLFVVVVLEYVEYRDYLPPWAPNPYPMMFARHAALQVLAIAILVLMFLPGVRRWTPRKPATALVMMVPAGHPGTPLPQQGAAPQQHYPPRY
jgi:hypothetical protein